MRRVALLVSIGLLMFAGTASAQTTGSLSDLASTTPNASTATVTGTAAVTYNCNRGEFSSCVWSPYLAFVPTGGACPSRGTHPIPGSVTTTPSNSSQSYSFGFSIDRTPPSSDTVQDVCLYVSESGADTRVATGSVTVQDPGVCKGIAAPVVTPADGSTLPTNAVGIDARYQFSDRRITGFSVWVTPPNGSGIYDASGNGNVYTSGPGDYTIKFRGKSRWYDAPGQYILRVTEVTYSDSYRDGSAAACRSDPKFSTTLTLTARQSTPSNPSPGDNGAPPANPLAMTQREAIAYSRTIVRQRRGKTPRDLKRGCTRRTASAYRCILKWSDSRYRWSGYVDLRHYVDPTDDGVYVAYRFVGKKVRRACRSRCSAPVIWRG